MRDHRGVISYRDLPNGTREFGHPGNMDINAASMTKAPMRKERLERVNADILARHPKHYDGGPPFLKMRVRLVPADE